jgi:hypothetical protein
MRSSVTLPYFVKGGFVKRVLAGLAVVGALLTAGTASSATVIPVMTGLDNPRGLDFGPDGNLYVAEAGRGGSGPCRSFMGATECLGTTGAISRLRNGVQEKWLTGLPSLAVASGDEATGPHDVAFQYKTIPFFGRSDAHVTIGLGGDPAQRPAFGAPGALLGTLLRVSASRQVSVVADIAALEAATNPAGGPIDSNPFGVLPLTRLQYVADAGGNTIVQVAGGTVGAAAVFPPRPNPLPFGPPFVESVPTALALGPDGAVYSSELTGAPFPTGFSRIHRVGPSGSASVFATGLTAVTDLAFGHDGALYALQFASCGPFFACPGSIVRVNAGPPHTVVAGGLIAPTGLAIGPDGAFYVSQWGASAGIGEVLRIVP